MYSSEMFGLSHFSSWVLAQERLKKIGEKECQILQTAVQEARLAHAAPLVTLRNKIHQLIKNGVLSNETGAIAKKVLHEQRLQRKKLHVVTPYGSKLIGPGSYFRFDRYVAFPENWRSSTATVFLKHLKTLPLESASMWDRIRLTSLAHSLDEKPFNDQEVASFIETLNAHIKPTSLLPVVTEKFYECLYLQRDLKDSKPKGEPYSLITPARFTQLDPQSDSPLVLLPVDILCLISQNLPLDAFLSLLLTCKKMCALQAKLLFDDGMKMSRYLQTLPLHDGGLLPNRFDEQMFKRYVSIGDGETILAKVAQFEHQIIGPQKQRMLLRLFPNTHQLRYQGTSHDDLLDDDKRSYELTKLHFTHSPTTFTGFRKLIERCPKLKEIEFENCYLVKELSSLSLPAGLQRFRVKKSSAFGDECLESLVTTCSNLQELHIVDCSGLTSKCLKSIARLNCLETLSLRSVRLDEETLIEILTSCSKLRHITIHYPLTRILNENLHDVAFPQSLEHVEAGFLLDFHILKKICASCPNLQFIDPYYLARLTSAMIQELMLPASLREINLGTEAGMTALAHVLSRCPRLERLRFLGMSITSIELESLTFPATLQELALYSLSLDKETARSLLSKCPTLKHLTVADCEGITAKDVADLPLPQTLESLELQMAVGPVEAAHFVYQLPNLSYFRFGKSEDDLQERI